MNANPVSTLKSCHPRAQVFNDARNLVTQGQWQRMYRRPARPVVGVRVADSGCADTKQHFQGPRRGYRHVAQLQRFSRLDQTDSSHKYGATAQNCALAFFGASFLIGRGKRS